MKLLFIGDVVGKQGCEFLAKNLYHIKQETGVDLTVINGENSAAGNGITRFSAEQLTNLGADVITTGNHAFKRRESLDIYETMPHLIRPANYPAGVIGRGWTVVDAYPAKIAVINLMGVVYLEALDNPFDAADKILAEIAASDTPTPNIFVDFHAEATAEKKALGHYLAGRVTAVIGTHTHVQTADETILEGKTAYLTDAGMTGPENSVLGVQTEIAVEKQRKHFPVRFVESNEPCFLNGVVIDFDERLGKATKITRIIHR